MEQFINFDRFFGTDWAAVLCMCIYIWRLGSKKRDAFIWGAASNVFFVVFNFLAPSLPGAVFNAVFFFMNLHAFMRWARPQSNESSDASGC